MDRFITNRLFLLLVTALFSIPQFTYSQNADSLWNLWNDHKQSDSVRIAAMQLLCMNVIADNYPDSAFGLATEMHELAIGSGNKRLQADALNVQAYTFYIRGDYAEAKEYYEKSFRLSKVAGCTKRMAISYGNIGNIYKVQGNWTEAFVYLERCLQLEQEMGNVKGVASNYNDIGRIYLSEGNYTKALEYFDNGLKIRKEINDIQGIAWSYNNIGYTYLTTGNYIQALNFFKRSLEINNDLGYNTGIAYNNHNLGLLTARQGLYADALQYFQYSMDVFENTEDKFGISMASINIGEVKTKENKFREAIEWCEKGFVLAENIGALEQEIKGCDCLYKANKALGEGLESLKYLEQLVDLQQRLKIDNATIKLQQIEFKRQRLADSLMQVEAMLKSEFEYQESLNKEKNTRNTFMFTGIGILLIAGGLFSRVLYIRKTNKELEQKNKMIAKEKERVEESEQAKEKFFDNVSHEFRTPITLILGPIDEVLESNADENTITNLTIAQRNAQRLENMIDELLNLSKLEFGKIKLEAKEEDIVGMIDRYLQSYQSLADQRNIKLSLESDKKECLVFIDSEKIKKTLNNLLFNACKFTDDGGEIKVTVSDWQSATDGRLLPANDQNIHDSSAVREAILISVSDTGIGIPKDELDKIFDRFYQVKDAVSHHSEGTGIGLALARELVELHHGKIWAESEPGKGATFYIWLLLGSDHLSPEEIKHEESEIDQSWTISKDITGTTKDASSVGEPEESELPILLIVEDNPDLRMYIKGKFENDYKIVEAGNGEEGLKLATEHIPDLVVCDVMMPRMDGIKMTRQLKSDERTSHIPIILLTARASTESTIEGLETGADAYVTKPFNTRELKVRVRKIIERRKSLRDHFKHEIEHGYVKISEAENLTSMDQQFMQKVMDVVQKHIPDHDFDNKTFGQEIGLSRVQLHRKLRAITGKTTTEFIRTIRMNKAKELLARKTGNISQVAYEVGYSSLSYFTKRFQEQYGVTPSEFLEQT